MANKDIGMIAHLMRRAGFGATGDELLALSAKGYEAVVEEMLSPANPHSMPDDIIRRYHHEQSGMMGQQNPGAYWLYRMITTNDPLREKMTLFWHGVFATAYSKLTQGKVLMSQINMLRRNSMGNFRTVLVELSKDPAMVFWLDNHDNHKEAINENYGRELLELFSMGVGNYTEQDIKECARAFTGWTIANTEYMELRARRDSIWPYGRLNWHFEYRAEDHDDGEKEFLGHRGRFNGEDIIDIICQQPATARFLSRHLYNSFVADEPPVPQWPYSEPRDPEAIEILSRAYFDSNYDISYMLKVLFTSDFFKSESVWYEKVKSPAELVAGVLRLTGEFEKPRRDILDRANQMTFMGQQLINPPTVEGWHQGTEWIDTGTLAERINFVTQQLGDLNKPGTRAMVENIISNISQGQGGVSPERLVNTCLEQLGTYSVSQDTRDALVRFASQGGELDLSDNDEDRTKVAQILQLTAAAPEFQRS